MPKEVTCSHCGEKFTILAEDFQDANVCDECWDYLEQAQQEQDYDQRSDADPGL